MTVVNLVLASASPRRSELMKRLGLPFRLQVSGVIEVLEPELPPAAAARNLAADKVRAVGNDLKQGLVIGADTIVVVGGAVLEKPLDERDAVRMLQSLRGRTHQVVTALAVFDAASGRLETRAVSSEVSMRSFADAEVEDYVASGEPMGKAGAYAIQGRGGTLIEGLKGCFNNVVGFPLCEVGALLLLFGVKVPNPEACRLPSGSLCPRLINDQAAY